MLYNKLVMNNLDVSEIILNRIVAINTIAKNDHRVVTRNDRSTYALTMKIAGRTTYVCGGERFVSDVNNMLLVDKNARYQWHMDEKGKCVMIEFEGKSAASHSVLSTSLLPIPPRRKSPRCSSRRPTSGI